MPSKCSMLGCQTGKKGQNGKRIRCFPFPRSEMIRQQWIQALGRKDYVLKPSSRVCEKHFHESCFLSFYENHNSKNKPRRLRNLRENAVPGICLPDGIQRVQITHEHNYFSHVPPDVDFTDIQMEVTINSPMRSTVLMTNPCNQCANMLEEAEELSKEIIKLKNENERLRQFFNGVAKIFNEDQMEKMLNPDKRFHWSQETLTMSLKLYNKSWSAYKYLTSLGYPLPCVRQIQRVKEEGVTKVAVVTGASAGVGLAVVKSLARSYKGDVYLTTRCKESGEQIVKELEDIGLKAHSHPLDVTNQESIDDLAYFLRKNYGGLNVLVNNAAIEDTTDAKRTLGTNYFGVKNVCETLFPILKSGARVVNVTRNCGLLYRIPSDDLKAMLKSEKLTIEELDKLMNDFIEAADNGQVEEKGWPNNSYIVSKVGLGALTRILQRIANEREDIKDVAVNHVHPGSIEYDPENQVDSMTFESGVKSCLFAATLPAKTNIKGSFIWKDCSIIDWANMKSELADQD